MREFLKNYSEYEYAIKSRGRLVASFLMCALAAIPIAVGGLFITLVGLRVFTILGVFGW